MNYDELLKRARAVYLRGGEGAGAQAAEPFPAAPGVALTPGEFVDRMTEAAFERSAKLHHPFAMRLGRGAWTRAQVREWVRQDYQRTVYTLRRHALIAANAADYETIWGLIARVKAEADADPVGGTFFALPQLWLKFGIALGLERQEMIESTPHPELRQANEAMVDELRLSGAMPVLEFIDAMLDPVFYRLWGEVLASTLELDRESLDFFWAIAADRWGAETGRAILEKWAGARWAGARADSGDSVTADGIKAAQTTLWKRLAEEMKEGREWRRFSILQSLLESVAG
jgi:hypothetical protein